MCNVFGVALDRSDKYYQSIRKSYFASGEDGTLQSQVHLRNTSYNES